MSGVHNKKRVCTRKEHRCAYCRSVIPKGATVQYESGIYDHVPYARYACDECEPNLDAFWKWCNYECEGQLDESFAYFLELKGDA